MRRAFLVEIEATSVDDAYYREEVWEREIKRALEKEVQLEMWHVSSVEEVPVRRTLDVPWMDGCAGDNITLHVRHVFGEGAAEGGGGGK